MTQERKAEVLGKALEYIFYHVSDDNELRNALMVHLGMTAEEVVEMGFEFDN